MVTVEEVTAEVAAPHPPLTVRHARLGGAVWWASAGVTLTYGSTEHTRYEAIKQRV